ncbi:cupin domain-containing protein [Anthocerotibacter panamensis]|uniref:cupin domain-containing protein n=1 Tax=Anthocerotibacter panamensis TaxID=2857077 RepID=UPI001C4085DD|nr:cupin domain-containing protein [Anthocerotibacter panamensis]
MNEPALDLASLAALELIDAAEREDWAALLAEAPELEQELAEFQTAAALIGYGAPSVPLNPQLKDRLHEKLNQEPEDLPFVAVRAQTLQWQQSVIPGVMFAALFVNEPRRLWSGLLRAQPGVHYPLHRHAHFEEMYMLSGDLVVNGEVYGPGDYLRSATGTCHDSYTPTGCMFFFHTSLDDEFLEPEYAMTH